MSLDVRRAGERALLVQVGDRRRIHELRALLATAPLAGQLDVVAAAETVLVRFATAEQAERAASIVRTMPLTGAHDVDARTVTIDVSYRGADLVDVAAAAGLTTEGVIAAHTSGDYVAAFSGFAPGFVYLEGLDPRLHVPRLDTPRTAVPAGSVAIAGSYSAVYPRESPGGWRLLGHTDAVLWSLDRERPALIRPGDRVRFRAVRESVAVAPTTAEARHVREQSDASSWLTVESPGLLSLVEDLGRPGYADLGVPTSGAADERAARLANRVVGNPPGDAVIEHLGGGLRLRAEVPVVLAIAGARADARVGSRAVPLATPFELGAGDALELGPADEGVRAYVAVRGGLDVPRTLGSRSTDTLSGLGPAPLRPGDRLPVGAVRDARPVGNPEPTPPLPRTTATLRATLGPRDDWFTASGLDTLATTTWRVSAASNRIGVRLEPADGAAAVERSRTDELPSEGVVLGAVQVPPSGHPVVFLADHPVTGGYPVAAVVRHADLGLAAQLQPGDTVRFALEPID